METAPVRLGAALQAIQRTPLTRISPDQTRDIVSRIVIDRADSPTVKVATFGSSI